MKSWKSGIVFVPFNLHVHHYSEAYSKIFMCVSVSMSNSQIHNPKESSHCWNTFQSGSSYYLQFELKLFNYPKNYLIDFHTKKYAI